MCCHSKSLCLCFETACLLVTHVLCHTTHITKITPLEIRGYTISLFKQRTYLFDSCWFSCPSIFADFLSSSTDGPSVFYCLEFPCEAPISRSWSTLISWSLTVTHPRARWNPTISRKSTHFWDFMFHVEIGMWGRVIVSGLWGSVPFRSSPLFQINKKTGNTVSTSNHGGNGKYRFFW